MRSTTGDAHDAISFAPAFCVRTHLDDLAGKFQPGDVLGNTRRRGISTGSLQQVRAIKRGPVHPNEYLIQSRTWCRDILDLQNLRTTETSYNNSFQSMVPRKIRRR